MSWIKTKYGEVKADWEEESKARKESKQAAVAEYRKARQEQQIILARKKAVFEAGKRERQLKARYAPRVPRKQISVGSKTTGGFGFGSGSVFSMQPSNIMKPSYFAPAKPKAIPKIIKRKKRTKRKKSKGKAPSYIIRGGKAYPVG